MHVWQPVADRMRNICQERILRFFAASDIEMAGRGGQTQISIQQGAQYDKKNFDCG
jgi:hypothetical protein